MKCVHRATRMFAYVACVGIAVAVVTSCFLPAAHAAQRAAFSTLDDSKAPTALTIASGIAEPLMSLLEEGPAPDYSWYNSTDTSFTLSNEGMGKNVVNKLVALRNIVNGTADGYAQDDFYGKIISLAAEANFVGLEWSPIGTQDMPFEGTFNGGGNQVYGFQVTKTYQYAGFFGMAGESSRITNVRIAAGAGSGIMLGSEQSPYTGGKIEAIGSLVGATDGAVSNCYSNMNVTVYNDSTVSEQRLVIVDAVGGVAGRVKNGISNTNYDGSVYVFSASNNTVNRDQGYLIMTCIGGVVGFFGSMDDPTHTTATVTDCHNNGIVRIQTAGFSDNDRFGGDVVAQAGYVGGVVGYTTGSVISCSNRGNIDTSFRTAQAVGGAGWKTTLHGAGSYMGGVVGCLRADIIPGMTGTVEGSYDAGTGAQGNPIYAKYCYNTGSVFGNHAVGGVVGVTGWYSTVLGCYCDIPEGGADPDDDDYLRDVGGVKASRWNKPMAGGVVGKCYGDIAYCYNRSRVWSTTNGGYYVAGIVGVIFRGTSIDGHPAPEPEVYACYNTGFAQSGLRAASIAGQNEGYIHDCYALPDTSFHSAEESEVLVFSQYATVFHSDFIEDEDLKAAVGVGKLNAMAPDEDWQNYFVLPDASTNDGYPVLNWQYTPERVDLSQFGDKLVVTLLDDADYTGGPAVPTLQVKLSDGNTDTVLVQNADFKVHVANDAINRTLDADRTTGTRPYVATIEGIGHYQGKPSNSVNYGIVIGDLSSCTFAGTERVYTGQPIQVEQGDIKIITPSGSLVPADKFTFVVAAQNGDAPLKRGSYTVKATAIEEENANYTGTLFSNNAFVVAPADLHSIDVVVESISANGKSFDSAHLDEMEFTYTGSPIKPTVDSITYTPEGYPTLTLAAGESVTSSGRDYFVQYQSDGDYTNVPQDDPATEDVDESKETFNINIQSINPSDYGNYHNYLDFFFKIVPADINTADITVPDQAYTGQPRGLASITFNGMQLKEGEDYTVEYQNNVEKGSKATATIVGMGNFKGTATKSFTILNQQPVDFSSCTVADIEPYGWTNKPIKPTPIVTNATGDVLVEGKDYTVSYRNNVDAARAGSDTSPTVVLTGAGMYSGTIEKQFDIVANDVTVPAGLGRIANSKKQRQYQLDDYEWKQSAAGTVYKAKKGAGATVTFAYMRTANENKDYNITNVVVTGASGKNIPVEIVALRSTNVTGAAGINYVKCTFVMPDEDVTISEIVYQRATKDFKQCTVDDIAAKVYTGDFIEPAVVVRDAQGNKLRQGIDYIVYGYSNNTNVGTATITILGAGEYFGMLTKTFEIESNKLDFEASDVEYVYDGRPHGGINPVFADPAALVRFGAEEGDYTLSSCPTYTNVGMYTVFFRGTTADKSGAGSATITIKPRQATISAKDAWKVRGGSDPTFEVETDGVLPADEDSLVYSVVRAGAGADEDPGVYKNAITVQGKAEQGNYQLTFEPGDFEIRDWSKEMIVSAANVQATYDGKSHTIAAAKVNVPGDAVITYGTEEGACNLNRPPAFTDAGTHTVYLQAECEGYYSATGSAKVVIAKKQVTITADAASKEYGQDNPANVQAAVEGLIGDDTIDYTVAVVGVAKNAAAGTYPGAVRVSIAGDVPNYEVRTVNDDFTVLAKPVTTAVVSKLLSHAYDGKSYEPYPDVSLDGTKLVYGEDFTVSYKDAAGKTVTRPTEIGTYTVAISGKGNYGSSARATATFKITGDISKADITVANQTYSGQAKKPAPVVKLNGSTLVLGTDYTVSYANNTAAGTATVTIKGKGNYTSSVSKTFKIMPANISKATVTGIADKTYTGKAITQSPVVKLGSTTLKAGTDYTVSYKNNVNAGTATVVIQGKGNYTGTIPKTFKITRKAATTQETGIPVYWLVHKKAGENLYTTDANEVKQLSKGNWQNKGIVWYAPKSGQKVYRLYAKKINDHHYTSDINEVRTLTKGGTWKIDSGDVMWYSGGKVQTYRLFNPARNKAKKPGTHRFATSIAQVNTLKKAGWVQDGVKMYGLRVK